MSAVIGTQEWTANPTMIQATNSNGILAVGGMDASSIVQIQLRIVNLTQPVRFKLLQVNRTVRYCTKMVLFTLKRVSLVRVLLRYPH